MSDKMRWRYGDTNPVVAAVDGATVIEIGDLVYLDTDDAKSASRQAAAANLAAAQEQFAGKFLGVAMQRSRAGETDPIRVATTGVFEFDCPAGTFELGNLIGLAGAAGGKTLLNQQVATVAEPKLAIGRVARREPVASTTLLVDVRSTVMTGGVLGSTAAAAAAA